VINYYRGDRKNCPVSAGGGDVPTTRPTPPPTLSRTSSSVDDQAAPSAASSSYFVGPDDLDEAEHTVQQQQAAEKATAERKKKQAALSAMSATTGVVLPHGKTQVLDPSDPGPFIAEMEMDATQTTITNNCFIAPLFLHPKNPTDFLMTVPRKQVRPPRASEASANKS
jgi:hypothetical protein